MSSKLAFPRESPKKLKASISRGQQTKWANLVQLKNLKLRIGTMIELKPSS
jgi:hypothetical protein